MRQFYANDFFELLVNDGWIEKFLESGFCWNGCQTKNHMRLSDFLCVTVGWVSQSKKEIHEKLRLLLTERGVKGVRLLKMPEQITWCQCEPRYSEHQKLKAEFFDILHSMYSEKKKRSELDKLHKRGGGISQDRIEQI